MEAVFSLFIALRAGFKFGYAELKVQVSSFRFGFAKLKFQVSRILLNPLQGTLVAVLGGKIARLSQIDMGHFAASNSL